MPSTVRLYARIAAIALLATVITQIAYIAISSGGAEPPRNVLWAAETMLFLVIAVAGLALTPVRPLVGAALGVGGLLNLVQSGMGLVMFPALMDTQPEAFQAVFAMAFMLYFAGKVAFGVAALVLGAMSWRPSGGARKWLGGAAALAGLVAIALNLAAMASGMALVFPAGAAGTAAAALLAAVMLVMPALDETAHTP